MNLFNFGSLGEFKISKKFLEEKDWEGEEGFGEEQDMRPAELRFEFKRFSILKVLIVFCFLVLGWRLFSLQILAREVYRQEAEGNRIRTFSVSAIRGVIYDRQGNLLVRNIPSFVVVFVPADLPAEPGDREKLKAELANIIGKTPEEIEAIFQSARGNIYEPEILIRNLDREAALILDAKLSSLPGISLIKAPIREYIGGELISHILGYTGKISPEEYENKKNKGYFLTDWMGKQGVEYTYEEELRGEPGKKVVEVDSRGKVKRIVGLETGQMGKSLKLSLDLELQKKLESEIQLMLDKVGMRGMRAAALALDPQSGRILALVSLPTYDNNLFSRGISKEDLERINQDPLNPLFNRAIAGEYPPGSTIKPLIAVAALEEKVITPNFTLSCPGSLTYYGFGGTTWHFADWKAHGATNLRKAIAESCNVFFYTVGGGNEALGISGLGIKLIKGWAKSFGLGNILGVDLPGERRGLISDPTWKEEVKKEKWYIGDTYHISIGQGDILVTPLQIASITSTIANGGILYKPQIGYWIYSEENKTEREIEPVILKENFVKPTNLAVVREGMREAVTQGSARLLNELPVAVAGKTGTAQFGGEGKTHAWFTCFAPYSEPEIVLTVLVEEGGDGDKIAMPIAKEVLEWYFGRQSNE